MDRKSRDFEGKKGAGDRLPRFPGPVQPPPQRRHGCLCVPPRLRVSNNIAPKAAPGGAGTLRRLAPHRRPDEVDEIDDPSPEGAYIPDGSSCEEGRSGRRMHGAADERISREPRRSLCVLRELRVRFAGAGAIPKALRPPRTPREISGRRSRAVASACQPRTRTGAETGFGTSCLWRMARCSRIIQRKSRTTTTAATEIAMAAW